MEPLSSAQNPKIKQFLLLAEKARERNRSGLFVAEGKKEIGIAAKSGYSLQELFVCPELWETAQGLNKIPLPRAARYWSISAALFEKMAYRSHSDGLLAIARQKPLSLESLPPKQNPLYFVLESVEKPGNLGAILRTADAVGASGVIVCDPQTDVFNPNVVRSSLGCLFSVPVARCTSEEALSWLRERKIQLLAAELNAAQEYHCVDLGIPTALVLGTEAEGLTDFWIQGADGRIKIPMLGQVDSLNVSVSAAVLAYEAMRQRNFKVSL